MFARKQYTLLFIKLSVSWNRLSELLADVHLIYKISLALDNIRRTFLSLNSKFKCAYLMRNMQKTQEI